MQVWCSRLVFQLTLRRTGFDSRGRNLEIYILQIPSGEALSVMVASIFMYKVVEEKILHKWRDYIFHYVRYVDDIKGGPEPLENEINKILGSKRKDRFLDNFFRSGTKYLFGSFFVPASPEHFL